MHFSGDIYFDFETYDVWRLHTILARASQARGVTVSVEWRPFLVSDVADQDELPRRIRALAVCEAVRATHPVEYDKFVRSLLTMAYQEKDDPGSKKILAVAARVAGIEGGAVVEAPWDDGLRLLRQSGAAARERGVDAVPTIVRQGPPLHIETTGAAILGDAVARLGLIHQMLDDDGIWRMSKP